MRYLLDGPDTAPVVMLAHSILTSLQMWDGVASQLAPRWRVLRYDLRGHGGTAPTQPPYTMEQLASDAIKLLDMLGIQRVHFIGSSLGGMIGQQLGARFSARLHSLTLANTAAVQGAPELWDGRIARARDHGSVAPLVEPTLQRWFTASFLSEDQQAVARMRLLALALATSLDGFIGCATAVRDLDQANLLGRISVPTLVIAGKHDTAIAPAQSLLLHEAIAGAQWRMLPAAHQAAVECPAMFAGAWERWATHLPMRPRECTNRSAFSGPSGPFCKS